MKKFMQAALVGLVLFTMGAQVAQAGTADLPVREIRRNETRNRTATATRDETIVVQGATQYRSLVNENRVSETHRVVSGLARVALRPNFLDNDWDNAYIEGFGRVNGTRNIKAALLATLSDGEEAFLRTLTGLPNGREVFVDLDGRTTRLDSNFQPFSRSDGSTTTSSTSTASTSNNSSRVDTDITTTQSVEIVEIPLGSPPFLLQRFITTVTDILTTLTTVNTTTVTNTDTVTTTTTNNYTDVSYQVIAVVYDASPVILDLSGDRKIDTAHNDWRPHAPKFYKEYAKFFDITGDGAVDFSEWMSANPQDGLLCMPVDGKIENALQLFGTAGGYKDGYEKLAILCDKDKNGWVEGNELNGLMLWIDANSNANCEDGELRSLASYKVAKINCNHSNWVSSYKTTDGKSHVSWDWWPAACEIRMIGKN